MLLYISSQHFSTPKIRFYKNILCAEHIATHFYGSCIYGKETNSILPA